MKTSNPPVRHGYSPVPQGCLANVVTCLEMGTAPSAPKRALPDAVTLDRWLAPPIDDYRRLFKQVGQDWMWSSRVLMADAALAAILSDPLVEVYALRRDGEPAGILELDFRDQGQCELAFFGLLPQAIGQGLGRAMMDEAIARAWARPITRFWVHTCTFDHPSAVAFYIRSGFRPYAIMVEVHEDPRLTGKMPRSAAPHVPLLEP